MRGLLLFLLVLQSTAQTRTFEVASIRPGNRTSTRALCRTLQPSTDSVFLSAVWPLSAVIEDAYLDQVDDFDFPQWSRAGTYAINVKVLPNTSVAACREMLRSFLAERFRMVTGVETRDVARYYVKVAKSGLKLKPVNPPADPNAAYSFDVKDGNIHYSYRGAPMSRILNAILAHATLDTRARSLRDTGSVNDPGYRFAAVNGVVDETGLTGYYEGALDFAPTASARSEFAESLADTLTRQLGLTLELRRAPGKVLFVRSSDHTPTEN